MSVRLIRMACRVAALAIAVIAAIDPVLTIERGTPAIVTLVDMTHRGIEGIQQSLDASNAASIVTRTPTGGRIPCAPGEPCVIVADGSVAAELPGDAGPVLLVIDDEPAAPNVRLLSATFAAPHLLAGGSARIALEARGSAGRQTTILIRDGETTLGSARHQWTGDGTVAVDVPWWPPAAGPRLLRVEAVADAEESTASDNAIDVSVSIAADKLPILVFDARPSWSSTFVRRALEDDPRFAVEHRARVAPSLAVATPAGRLDAQTLDMVSVVIVGGPEALSEREAALIDRFVRVRGGTAILLPERPPIGPAARLFRTEWDERLNAEPQSLGPLSATEVLRATSVPLGSTVLATLGGRPVVALMPTGDGAVLVSGAMDAWRFRGLEFERFWRSVAAQAAFTSPALEVAFDDAPARPGTRQRFTVRRRSMQPAAVIAASAVARCGAVSSGTAPARAIRLWPAGAPATFAGEIAIGDEPVCELEVTVGESSAISGIAVTREPAVAAHPARTALEHSVMRAGGTITHAADVHSKHLGDVTATPAQVPLRPMQSPWWMLPFTLCLSVEWWLRRREGLR
jgi:hypothetical protein